LGRILDRTIGNVGGKYMPILIHGDVELLPTLAPLLSMLPGVPFSFATNLQPGAIHDEAQRSIWQIRDALPDFNGPIPT
jgi:hypothetical protein